MKTLITTLCIVHQHPRILLGMKKRGFAAGKWNGFGGKVEVGTIEENAKREMSEECGLEIKNMDRVGLIDFEFKDNPEIIQVHFFKVNEFAGEPTETEEMMPKELILEEEVPWNYCRSTTVHYWYLYKASSQSEEIILNKEEEKSIGWYAVDEIKKLNLEPVWEYWLEKVKII